MSTDMMVVYTSILIPVGWAAVHFGLAARREVREERAWRERNREVVDVVLNGGYHPERIVVHRGRPIRLNVTRTNDDVSGWIDFEFPYACILRDLPEDDTVTIDIEPLEPGEYTLFAASETVRGTLVVEAKHGGTRAKHLRPRASGEAPLTEPACRERVRSLLGCRIAVGDLTTPTTA